LLGVRSIALSQAYTFNGDGRRDVPWETAETHAPPLIRKLLDFGFPDEVLYNINFPNRMPDAISGVMVTGQGKLAHRLHIDERRDGRGNPYFWLAYRPGPKTSQPGTDLEALETGKVSVTPLRLDMTAYDLGDPLRHHLDRA
jgi:5'-nucleotidase